MATLYGSTTGGNFSAATAWDLDSGGAGGDGPPTAADDCILNASTAAMTISASITINSLVCTGYTNTLTHNASVTLTIDSQDGSGNSLLMVAGMTYTLGNNVTSRITFTGAGTNKITTGGKAIGRITFDNSGDTFQLQDALTCTYMDLIAGTFDANSQTVTFTGEVCQIVAYAGTITFYNLTRTGTATKSNTFLLVPTIVVTNILTLTGNSSINRLLVYSNTLGAATTITYNGAANPADTISNCDFRDITVAGTYGAWDLSGITGDSGNCGGNTNITFTTADTMYWHVDGGSWSDSGQWFLATNGGGGVGRVPLPQDDVMFDANSFDSGSQIIDVGMPRLGKSIDFTGVTNTPTFDKNTNVTLYGSFICTTGMLVVGAQSITFEGRGAFNFDPQGRAYFAGIVISMFGGSLTLLSSISSTLASLSLYNGTFDANDYDVATTMFTGTGTYLRTLNMGSGTWSSNRADTGTWWNIETTTNLTFDAETSTISGISQKFYGGGLTYNNLTINTGGSGTLQFYDGNTFNTFTTNAPKTVKFTDGTTTTVSSFVATGDASNAITLTGTSTGGWAINDTAGTNQVYYCDIAYSTAGGGASWLAYTTDGNTDGGNNTGWVFTAPAGEAITTGFMTTRSKFW